MSPPNAQLPGPLDAKRLNGGPKAYPSWARGSLLTAEANPWFVATLEDCDNTETTARLLAASYTMADRAGRSLGVDAADLCAKTDLAALIRAAQTAVEVLEQGTDWRDTSPAQAAAKLRAALPAVFVEPRG